MTLSVEFPQMQYADLSELIHVLKTVAIVTSEHLKLMDNSWQTCKSFFDC